MHLIKCDGRECTNSTKDLDDSNEWLTIGSSDGKSLYIQNNLPDKSLNTMHNHSDIHFCSIKCLTSLLVKADGLSDLDKFLSQLKGLSKVDPIGYTFIYKDVWCYGVVAIMPFSIRAKEITEILKISPMNRIDDIGGGTNGAFVTLEFKKKI